MTEVQVNTVINNPDIGKTINQFTTLKNEIKAAKGELAGLEEGTEAFAKQAAKVGELNNRINSLTANISAVSGAPIENLTSSFSNLSGQLGNLDFKSASVSLTQFTGAAKGLNFKTLTDGAKAFGTGLLDLGKVLITSPLFITVAVVTGIGAALFALKDKVKIIGDAFDFFGGIISDIVDDFKDFTDNIGLTTFALDELAEKTKKTASDNFNTLNSYYDNILKLAKANGEDTTKIEKEKLDAFIKFNENKLADLRKKLNEEGELNKDEKEQFTKLAQDITNARSESIALDLSNERKAKDERIKLYEQEQKELQGIRDRNAKRDFDSRKSTQDAFDQNNKEVSEREQKEHDQEIENTIKEIEARKAQRLKDSEDADAYFAEQSEKEDKRINEDLEKKLKNEQKFKEGRFEIAQQGINGLQALSDIYFEIQSANLEKGSKEEDEAARKRFKINKGLQLANATIQGIQGVLAAFSSGAAIPIAGVVAGPAFAAVAGAVAVANIAKIAATQYQSSDAFNAKQSVSSGSGSASVNIPSSSGPSTFRTPSFNPQAVPNSRSDLNSDVQKLRAQKVYILESEIRETTNKVDLFETRATI